MNDFSIQVALPTGAMLVEASAGTGKTWSIARLVARLIAEDPPEGGAPPTIDRILVVTFTNAATAELRDRVRAVLCEAAEAIVNIEDAIASGAKVEKPTDPANRTIAGHGEGASWLPYPATVLQLRAARLRAAIRDFDSAGISTIHGFCQQVLQTLAFESNASFDAELMKNTDDLVDEIVDDWMATTLVPADEATYVWLVSAKGANLNRARLVNLARLRVSMRDARVIPDSSGIGWRDAAKQRSLAAQTLLERFNGDEGSALMTLLAGGTLNAGTYGPAKLGAQFQAMTSWLEAGALEARPTDVFTTSKVRAATKKNQDVVTHPLLDAVEELGAFGNEEHALADFLEFVLREYESRLRAQHALTFDDLLAHVAAGLHTPALLEGLRSRYRVALIDEFQDTDAVQWEVFRRVFLEDATARLILIGDPKQAIYAFRNADVAVYTAARAVIPVDRQYTMVQNFRSDKPLLRALNGMLGAKPNVLLTPGIEYEQVRSELEPGVHDAEGQPVPPITLRWFDGSTFIGPIQGIDDEEAGSEDSTAGGERTLVPNAVAEAGLTAVVARDIADELRANWSTTNKKHPGPLRPRHFAVLVHTNKSAAAMRDALVAAGVPAVVAQAGSVFKSVETTWLERWLLALASDSGESAARSLAITPLFGFTARNLLDVRLGLDSAASADWLAFKESLAEQAGVLDSKGVTAAFSMLLYTARAPGAASPLARLASSPSGERHLTNLRHLAELLDAASHAEHLGQAGLAQWLSDRRQNPDDADGTELRLESDSDTVKVVTLHKSKGLEYPIVYLPALHDGRPFRVPRLNETPIRFHIDSTSLAVDMRGFGAASVETAGLAVKELIEERQRLLYVALTRAEHRVVLYAGASKGASLGRGMPRMSYPLSPLGVLLHGEEPTSDSPSDKRRDDIALASLAPRFDTSDKKVPDVEGVRQDVITYADRHHIQFEDVRPLIGPVESALQAGGGPSAPPAVFSRTHLDLEWRRESYSGLVKKRKGKLGSVDGLDEGRDYDDEFVEDDGLARPSEDDALGADAAEDREIEDPEDLVPADASQIRLRTFPGGAEAGIWVHGVFEHASFTATPPAPKDQALTMEQLIRAQGQRAGFPKDQHDALLRDALTGMLATPLGPQLGGLRLADIPDIDRLDELKFDIAIGRGEDAEQSDLVVHGSELAAVIGAARPDDPMPPGYLAHVRAMGFRPLVGYLTGAMDLVFRADVNGARKWFVADYKTNTLGPRVDGRVARSAMGHYARPWMAAEIARKHYYVQYVIYLTALHRYLSLRQKGYSYETDVGGAAYLFVRGMEGAGGPTGPDGTPHGVFIDKPPFAVIDGLSRLLGRVEHL